MTKRAVLLAGVLTLGLGLRAAGVERPIDRAGYHWRESDLASIARNYDREGMDLLHPRVDWRGDGPGYAEMEFPVYPWAMAAMHRAFGMNEAFAGRLLALGFSIVALATFVLLARHLLPWPGALAASAFFALSPLVVQVGHLLLADGLMLMLYLIAVYAFVRFLEAESPGFYWLALLATAAAILSKAPAAHVGLLFAFLACLKFGRATLRQRRLWLFAAVAVALPLPWYLHARHLWTTYGNSLGVSNEYHWVGLDLFTNPRFLLGIGKLELLYVWMPPTVVLACLAVRFARRSRAFTVALAWLAAVAIYYLVICRTASGVWAIYYHVVSVPAVALLAGAAVAAIAPRSGAGERAAPLPGAAAVWAGLASLAASLVMLLALDWAHLTDRAPDPLYRCARRFAPSIPAGALIVASGDRCVGPTGHPVAGNKPYFFYWLDRKGFNICEEEQSVGALAALARRGAGFFVAEKSALQHKRGFETELRGAFPVIDDCDAALLVRLIPAPAPPG